MRPESSHQRGFTLIESLVGLGLLLIVMSAVLALYYSGIQAVGIARARITAIALANEQLELVRNLPYSQIGTTTGWPTGSLLATKTIDQNGLRFTVTTYPKYVDDPFDGNALGTIAGKPVDTQPSDYKLVEIRVCWSHYPCLKPVSVSSTISSLRAEGDDGTGSLFIQTLNAGGLSTGQATVTVTNASTTPAINITSSTDINGILLLSSLPPAQDTYHITITKAGFNDDYTLAPTAQNPNPTKKDASVFANQVTPLTFFVDRTANLALLTVDSSCVPIPNVPFSLRGTILDGANPDVFRYDSDLTTNALGRIDLPNLHWDTYTQTIDPAAGFDVTGTTISQPFSVLPESDQTVYIHLGPDEPNSLMVTVRESGTLVPLSDATVRLENFSGYDTTQSTGQGTFEQQNWVGGDGQIDFADSTKYFSQDGNLDTSQPNSITLLRDTAARSQTETFESDLYEDYGATTADWNTGLGIAQLKSTFGVYDASGLIQTLTLNTDSGEISDATLTVNENLNGQAIAYELSADGGLTYDAVTPGSSHTFTNPGRDLRLRATLTTSSSLISPELLDFTVQYSLLTYRPNGSLISSTINLGPDAVFNSLQWLPTSQPPATGTDSLKIQVATNTDQASWIFVGPDGTAATAYSTSGDTLWSGHTGDQYLRYKVILSTVDPAQSPALSSVSLIHSAGCVPPGQTYFAPLAPGSYQITVDRPGYSQYINSVEINGDSIATVDLAIP